MTVRFVRPEHLDHLVSIEEPGAARGSLLRWAESLLDARKIDAYLLEKDRFGYVGLEGDDFQPQKHNRVARQLQAIQPVIEMPIMYGVLSSWYEDFAGSIQVADGRHRLYALSRISQCNRVPVMVPEFQKVWFEKALG
jgi:hypothetical protein